MIVGLGALVVGIAFVIIGTRFRSSVAGSVLVILGSAITAVGVVFIGIEGLSRDA